MSNTKTSAITPWAARQDVRELGERLQTMMPGAQRLTKVEALSLAQAAVAHGLDPFNGELWFLKDKSGKPLGLMAGIKGHRRSAHRQMKEEGGGNYWPDFDVLDTDEKAALGIPPDALAYRCRIRDTHTIEHYVSQIERLLKAGLDWDIVSDLVGSRPYTEGIGYAQKSERSKMTLVQRAMKRAEAEALKRRFDLPFGIAVGTTDSLDVIEGEFVTEEQDNQPRISQEAAEKAAEDTLPTTNDKFSRPMNPTDTRYSLRFLGGWVKGEDDKYADAHRPPDDQQSPPDNRLVQRIAAMMGKALARPEGGDTDLERHLCLQYLFGIERTGLLTDREAQATAKWQEAFPAGQGEDGKDAWMPSGVASEECRLVLYQAMKDCGQQEMDLGEGEDA